MDEISTLSKLLTLPHPRPLYVPGTIPGILCVLTHLLFIIALRVDSTIFTLQVKEAKGR